MIYQFKTINVITKIIKEFFPTENYVIYVWNKLTNIFKWLQMERLPNMNLTFAL